ncbi:DUF1194 domain-containing protein [Minwuia thermotolerans]|uniref:VWFA domain-containing protein n=1 Tax=Minwuia thermotolerans TaxID=2056226 RepID=A0A2M9G0P0_9PROT|nr:DUF1194 domain-containing protein [Minwuia thermotolerans]PJK29276.1 hypothetical protein CVT23_12860 [Minwuia thermotolerans]
MRTALAILALAALLLPPPGAAAREDARRAVDVEICLAVDGSGSIDADEFAFQREAYAQAIADRRVLDIIASGYEGGIAIAMMEWGGADSMNPVTDWHFIGGPETAADFAGRIRAAPRRAVGWNSISNAIAFCHAWIQENAYDGHRKVIDVSGDAGQYGGMPLGAARDAAVADGIVINALALNYRSGGMTGPGGMALLEHFRRDVIGGPWSFALPVDSPGGFREALVRKLILEIAQREAPAPAGG